MYTHINIYIHKHPSQIKKHNPYKGPQQLQIPWMRIRESVTWLRLTSESAPLNEFLKRLSGGRPLLGLSRLPLQKKPENKKKRNKPGWYQHHEDCPCFLLSTATKVGTQGTDTQGAGWGSPGTLCPGSKGRVHPAEEHSRGSIWVKHTAEIITAPVIINRASSEPRGVTAPQSPQ